MNNFLLLFGLFLLLFCGLGIGIAATTDNHTVTVTVNTINELTISGGNITLTVNSATAGSEPDSDADATTSLLWTSNAALKKVTVQTDVGSPNFVLKAVATGVTGGSPASEVTLSTSPQDFVTGVSTTTGSCTNQYTGAATAAQGTGSDIHSVTFTITDI